MRSLTIFFSSPHLLFRVHVVLPVPVPTGTGFQPSRKNKRFNSSGTQLPWWNHERWRFWSFYRRFPTLGSQIFLSRKALVIVSHTQQPPFFASHIPSHCIHLLPLLKNRAHRPLTRCIIPLTPRSTTTSR